MTIKNFFKVIFTFLYVTVMVAVFSFTVISPVDNLVASASVAAPVFSSFTTTPTAVNEGSGSSVIIKWEVENAESCAGTNFTKNPFGTSGNANATPDDTLGATTTYTITCTGLGGTTTESRTVTVTSASSADTDTDTGTNTGNNSSGGSGGGGSITSSSGGGSFSGGTFVAVAIPNEVSSVNADYLETPYLLDYMKLGWDNDPREVTKLQVFLREVENIPVEINGIFDEQTFQAVSQLQVRYSDEILSPWGFSEPTGFVYYTTKNKINKIMSQKIDVSLTSSQLSEIRAFKALLEANPDAATGNVGFLGEESDETTIVLLENFDETSSAFIGERFEVPSGDRLIAGSFLGAVGDGMSTLIGYKVSLLFLLIVLIILLVGKRLLTFIKDE